MAATKTKTKSTKTTKAPKAAKKDTPAKTSSKTKGAAAVSTENLDHKALCANARQIKKELLAIRFNLQAPSLKEYRRKRAELQKFLAQLN